MTEQTDAELIEQAQAKREANPAYRPTPEELAAIDRLLIEQAKARLARSKSGPSCG